MRKIAGVDIGTHSVKIIELEQKKGRLEMIRCSLRRIIDNDKKTGLQEALSSARLTAKWVNVSLSGPSVIIRYIEMPTMKKEELKSAMKYEAEKYIPFNINESIIDCAVLNKVNRGAMRVLLVAAKKDEVNALVSLLKEVGLQINAIDIDSLAALNCFQRLNVQVDEGKTYALVNIGHKFSNMDIVTKDGVCFTRDILWGGGDITTRIKDALNIRPEEAEVLKQNPGERRQEVRDVILPVLERFVSQLRISFDFFESQHAKNVDRIYISGGGSYLFNMVDFLKENLGIEAMMWNPLEGIAVTESVIEEEVKKSPALFAVAVGLALRK